MLTHAASGTDLSIKGDATDFFDMKSVASPRSRDGFEGLVPAEWQPLLGYPAFTGRGGSTIVSNSRFGPSITLLNPNDVGVKDPIPSTTTLYYPEGHPLGWSEKFDGKNVFWNSAGGIAGGAFPSGSRTILLLGVAGYGVPEYRDQKDGDCSPYKGYHADPYYGQIWAYDTNNFLAVKNGTKQPWDLKPYASWKVDDCDSSSCINLNSATSDQANGLMYFTEGYGGGQPRVHVYRIHVPNKAN